MEVLGPYSEQVARATQTALGGRSKLYQATKKHLAEAEYLKFLRAVVRGHDSW